MKKNFSQLIHELSFIQDRERALRAKQHVLLAKIQSEKNKQKFILLESHLGGLQDGDLIIDYYNDMIIKYDKSNKNIWNIYHPCFSGKEYITYKKQKYKEATNDTVGHRNWFRSLDTEHIQQLTKIQDIE